MMMIMLMVIIDKMTMTKVMIMVFMMMKMMVTMMRMEMIMIMIQHLSKNHLKGAILLLATQKSFQTRVMITLTFSQSIHPLAMAPCLFSFQDQLHFNSRHIEEVLCLKLIAFAVETNQSRHG